ncbi:hypothetical protein KP78_10870 [Jeotgalibacillus soli]|uniref:Uncharacterized protein n=1 Tax=Jeotgalibacillus soli TaxID=889306 RepID=A0A0C2S6G5_9BACL|nr:hypothetical protein KP78_10870 [Jeotgalibacillus soli]
MHTNDFQMPNEALKAAFLGSKQKIHQEIISTVNFLLNLLLS